MMQLFRVSFALLAAFVTTPDWADEPVPSVKYVRDLLRADEQNTQRADRELTKLGVHAMPVYEIVLADPKNESPELIGAMQHSRDVLIKDPKLDRTQILELTVQLFHHDHLLVRRVALDVLVDIGSERDTAPVLAMLSDEENSVRHQAAKTLAKIGGKRDLVAVDIWLKTGNYRDDPFHLRHVRDCRDKLEKRLKEASKDKK